MLVSQQYTVLRSLFRRPAIDAGDEANTAKPIQLTIDNALYTLTGFVVQGGNLQASVVTSKGIRNRMAGTTLQRSSYTETLLFVSIAGNVNFFDL